MANKLCQLFDGYRVPKTDITAYELNNKFKDLQKHVEEALGALRQQAIDMSHMAKRIGDLDFELSEFKDSVNKKIIKVGRKINKPESRVA